MGGILIAQCTHCAMFPIRNKENKFNMIQIKLEQTQTKSKTHGGALPHLHFLHPCSTNLNSIQIQMFVLFFGGYFLQSRLCSSNSPTQLWTSNKTIPKYKQESPRTQVAYNAFSRPFLEFNIFRGISFTILMCDIYWPVHDRLEVWVTPPPNPSFEKCSCEQIFVCVCSGGVCVCMIVKCALTQGL